MFALVDTAAMVFVVLIAHDAVAVVVDTIDGVTVADVDDGIVGVDDIVFVCVIDDATDVIGIVSLYNINKLDV